MLRLPVLERASINICLRKYEYRKASLRPSNEMQLLRECDATFASASFNQWLHICEPLTRKWIEQVTLDWRFLPRCGEDNFENWSSSIPYNSPLQRPLQSSSTKQSVFLSSWEWTNFYENTDLIYSCKKEQPAECQPRCATSLMLKKVAMIWFWPVERNLELVKRSFHSIVIVLVVSWLQNFEEVKLWHSTEEREEVKWAIRRRGYALRTIERNISCLRLTRYESSGSNVVEALCCVGLCCVAGRAFSFVETLFVEVDETAELLV